MWAAGRVTYTPKELAVGDRVWLQRHVGTPVAKKGGLLVLVDFKEVYTNEKADVVAEEEITYAYRAVGHKPSCTDAAPAKAPSAQSLIHKLPTGPVDLFRYSAATFNAHRIHYDADYVREHESFPAPLVHGPLMSSHLQIRADDRLRALGHADGLRLFTYRAIRPAFQGEDLHVCIEPADDQTSLNVDVRCNNNIIRMAGVAQA